MSDIELLVAVLHDEYGKEVALHSSRELAENIVEKLTGSHRLGDHKRSGDWEPSEDDVDDAMPTFGIIRDWRAREIGYCAALALGRAGRLLPRVPLDMDTE